MANLLRRLFEDRSSERAVPATGSGLKPAPWIEAARGLPRRAPLQLDVYIVSLCQQLYSDDAGEVLSALMQLDTVGFRRAWHEWIVRSGSTQRRRLAITTAVMNAVFRPNMTFEPGQLATIRSMGMRIGLARLPEVLGERQLGTMFWDGLDFRRASFSGLKLAHLNFRKCVFDGVNFSTIDLRNARFVECSMAGAIFLQSRLSEADFSLCDLSATNFFGAEIRASRMQSCNLAQSNFASAGVQRSAFTGSQFAGATLRGARLAWCDFSGVEGLALHMLQEADFQSVLFVAPPPGAHSG